MCGIGGCVAPAGVEVPRARLAALRTALHHRGPDDSGIEIIGQPGPVGQVGLVQTRLAIIDPTPTGHAPMAARGWWLAYNGEVFNHAALRAGLPGRSWRGGSDTETIVELLAAEGPDALRRANGFFALAALDTAAGTLHLVRDRWGVKPLAWARDAEGILWWASELRALVAAGVPAEPDREVLRHGVALGWVNGPRTLLAGTQSVLGGERLEVDVATGAARTVRWATPRDLVRGDRVPALPLSGSARTHSRRRGDGRDGRRAALLAQLDAAVERRLLADVPVGTMCSGGIDSSLVTALVVDRDPSVLAFNAAITDQPAEDEHAFARAVCDTLGVELVTVPVSAETWRADFVATCRAIEAPMLHPSSVAMLQIARTARARGVKVLLSGEGADELFGGYAFLHPKARHDAARAAHPAERIARELWRVAGRRGLRRAALDPPVGRGPSPTANAYEDRVRDEARAAYPGGAEGRFAALLLSDLSTYLPHLLNRQDKAVMAQSVEMREPFLDAELVRFVLALPVDERVAPPPKGLLRELALERLPAHVVERPKRGFGIDTGAYLRGATRPEAIEDGALRELLGLEREPLTRAARDGALLPWSAEVLCRTLLHGESDAAVEAAIWR